MVLVSSQGWFRYDSVTQLDSTKLDSSTFFSFRATDEPRLFFAFALGSVKLIGACPILFLRRSKYLQITLQAILYDLPTSILHVCRKPGGCQSASPSGPVAAAAAALSSPLGMYPTLELGSLRQWIDPLSFLLFLFLCLSGPISRFHPSPSLRRLFVVVRAGDGPRHFLRKKQYSSRGYVDVGYPKWASGPFKGKRFGRGKLTFDKHPGGTMGPAHG